MELGAKEKRNLRWAKNAKRGAPDYPRLPFFTQDFKIMTDIRMRYEDKYVDEILCLIRKRRLAYQKAYDTTDRIMDLDFYKKLKDKYDQLNDLASASGAGFDLLVSAFDWDEEMIKYVRGERPNPHDESWTEAKRILAVMNVDGIHYRAIEILLGEGKIKVYDCNEPTIDEVIFFIHMQPLMDLFPILLRQSRNKDMNLPKNNTSFVCGLHVLAHIECLLTDREMAEPTTFLCDNAVENLQEVWAYGVLIGRLEPVCKEEPVK
ncbi:hypothetical protein FXO37_10844 [Capsicum annuum]|nr:hypothetical protein FXO37_10844 [Capsicum annuum]